MSFELDLEKYFTKTAKRLDDVSYNATVLMFAAVVFDTPVDSGALRANWKPSVGEGDYEITDILDPSGEVTISRIKEVVQPVSLNFLTNNLPYAPVVEYGTYPNPPKKSTGKTQGGYSIQSPFGMVTPNILYWEKYVAEAVRLAS